MYILEGGRRFPVKRYQKGSGRHGKEYKMSQSRADELQEELNYLKTTRSDEVAEQIKVARGFGDLSENSEYDEAKNEQGKLYSRIAELEEILQHVVIVDESSNTDMVVRSPHLPKPGETVLGGEFMMNNGGKGANQAVAAARLGG